MSSVSSDIDGPPETKRFRIDVDTQVRIYLVHFVRLEKGSSSYGYYPDADFRAETTVPGHDRIVFLLNKRKCAPLESTVISNFRCSVILVDFS